MNRENQKLRYDRLIILCIVAVAFLLTMWPALPATILILLFFDNAYEPYKTSNNYTITKYFVEFTTSIMFLMLVTIICLEYSKTYSGIVTELPITFKSCFDNMIKGNFVEYFKICIFGNKLLYFVYGIVACATATVIKYIAEKEDIIRSKRENYPVVRSDFQRTMNIFFENEENSTIKRNKHESIMNFFYEDENENKEEQKAEEKEELGEESSSLFSIFFIRPRLLVFLILNYFVFWFNVELPLVGNIITAFCYIVVIALALSDVAEWIMRKIEDVRHIATSTEKERLTYLFKNVKQRAMKKSKAIDNKLKLYIVDSATVNAFCIGKHTIAITRGLMETMNDEELEAIIAHEVGHIMNGDCQVNTIVSIASNVYIWSVLLVIKMLYVIGTLADGTFIGSLVSFIRNILNIAIKYAIMTIVILVASNSRKAEYKADKLAFKIGYGEALISALYKLYDMQISSKQNLISVL